MSQFVVTTLEFIFRGNTSLPRRTETTTDTKICLCLCPYPLLLNCKYLSLSPPPSLHQLKMVNFGGIIFFRIFFLSENLFSQISYNMLQKKNWNCKILLQHNIHVYDHEHTRVIYLGTALVWKLCHLPF